MDPVMMINNVESFAPLKYYPCNAASKHTLLINRLSSEMNILSESLLFLIAKL